MSKTEQPIASRIRDIIEEWRRDTVCPRCGRTLKARNLKRHIATRCPRADKKKPHSLRRIQQDHPQ